MPKKLKLKEGEVLCDKCYGKGFLGKGRALPICPKCFGAGKLDWIENVVGKRPAPRTLKAGWTIQDAKDFNTLSNVDLHDEIFSDMSKQMAENIDKEILEKLLKKGSEEFTQCSKK